MSAANIKVAAIQLSAGVMVRRIQILPLGVLIVSHQGTMVVISVQLLFWRY